jgi:hypothetical protein
MIKSNRMRWARDVAQMEKKIYAEYLTQQDHTSDLGIDRKIK